MDSLLYLIEGIKMRPEAQSTKGSYPRLHNNFRFFATITLICFILLSTSIIGAGSALSEKYASHQLEISRSNPEDLRAFFLAMPKGGDIHNHLTGGNYAESLIDQASDEGLCVSLANYTVSSKYCGSANSEPVRDAYSNSKLYWPNS